jgi:hypothetical protein
MLYLPRIVEAQLIGEHDLLEGLLEESVFVALIPRLGQLQLVEDTESHFLISRMGLRGHHSGRARSIIDRTVSFDWANPLGIAAKSLIQKRKTISYSQRVGFRGSIGHPIVEGNLHVKTQKIRP